MDITYSINMEMTPTQFINLLKPSTLGERRPLKNAICIKAMLDNADILVSAWYGDELVGIARSVTDFHYCCYLSDLAVSEKFQSKGIGKQLIKTTFEQLEKGCKLILLSSPKAVDYYPHIVFEKHNSAWILKDLKQLK